MFRFTADLRADAYSVDIPTSNVANTNNFYGRLVPEMVASWRSGVTAP